MKLSLTLIRDWLEDYDGVLIRTNQSEGEKSWYQVMYYDENEETAQEEVLLLGRAQDFLGELKGKGLISVGKPADELLHENDILYFPEDTSLPKLYFAIQKIYLRFQKWEDELQKAVRNDSSLEDLLYLAFEVFENSIFVHDENFNLLAMVNEMPGQQRWEYDAVKGRYRLPFEILNDFKVNPDYLESMLTEVPSLFSAETFGYRILYQNFYFQGKYRGRICINELGRTLRESDFYLLGYFYGILLEAFQIGKMTAYHGQNFPLSRYLVRLIEHESIDGKMLDKVMMEYGWTVSDACFCVCLFPEERDIHINSVQYYCTVLSERFQDVCVFTYEKSIVMLVNTTLNGLSISAFRNQIAVPLRESLMKAGISSVSTDLKQFYYMYRQAVCALEMGKKKQGTFWSYCFDDYQMDFIFQNALQSFPAAFLCSRELFYLIEYDKNHTSNLYRTLKIYLENDRNLARTAELLKVHRSTLLYRIGKIKELIKVNLEDFEIRFRLLLSIRLFEEQGGRAV
ncbi:MAG: helix-turn-helix domain-containing protein [Lachnospiraceae bacterium]|nr:helix-turn-helix domain-containing protein [Lachnospiraceae bacterium]